MVVCAVGDGCFDGLRFGAIAAGNVAIGKAGHASQNEVCIPPAQFVQCRWRDQVFDDEVAVLEETGLLCRTQSHGWVLPMPFLYIITLNITLCHTESPEPIKKRVKKRSSTR